MTSAYEKDVQDLTMELNKHKRDVLENVSYFDGERRMRALGLSTPPEMRFQDAVNGWGRMYLGAINERLTLEDFRLADTKESDDRLRSWWQWNMLDVESRIGHLEALLHGVSYITVSHPDESVGDNPEIPVFRIESPDDFIAKYDFRTKKVTKALRLYENPEMPKEDAATLMLPDRTVYLVNSSVAGRWVVKSQVVHNLGRVLVSPIVNRERLSQDYGTSEITKEIRSSMDAASRILMNLQTASELMALPQRILFGVTAEEFVNNPDDPGAVWDAYMARILMFDNDNAKGFQFNSADLRNYTDALQQLAKDVASYTGLPPQYLSFSSDNPASAEAIKSAESRLVKKCELKTVLFGKAWEEAMRLGILVMDGSIPQDAYKLEAVWADPSTPTFSSKADGTVKLHAEGIVPTEQARIDMGYSEVQRNKMREWEKDDATKQLNALMQQVEVEAKANPQNSGGNNESD